MTDHSGTAADDAEEEVLFAMEETTAALRILWKTSVDEPPSPDGEWTKAALEACCGSGLGWSGCGETGNEQLDAFPCAT